MTGGIFMGNGLMDPLAVSVNESQYYSVFAGGP